MGMLPCVSRPGTGLRTVRPGKIHFEVYKKKVRARLGGSIDVTTGGRWVTLGQNLVLTYLYMFILMLETWCPVGL